MTRPIHQHRRALGPTELVTELTRLNGERPQGWRIVEGALEKSFGFAHFHATMSFVNAVAHIANVEDHHPELQVSYASCTVRFSTHDVKGLTVSDFFCAAKVDALLD